VWGVACHPDGTYAVSASADGTVRVWDLETSTCQHILRGHTSGVLGVAYHPDGTHAVSASADRTVRVWDLATATCQHILEGHTSGVWGVAYHPDGDDPLGGGERRAAYLAGCRRRARGHTSGDVVHEREGRARRGEPGRQSGLAMRLAQDRWELTESTVGAWATQLEVPQAQSGASGGEREVWLWDFGGQADQRLIHLLYLSGAALAVLVFDGHREDTIARLWDWHRALRASDREIPMLLVAGRTDVNAVRLSGAQLDELRDAGGFAGYLETSAKNDIGCADLHEAILKTIDWDGIPHRSSPEVFRRLKRAILELKDTGRALTSAKELRDWLPAQIGPFEAAELDAVVGLLAGPGAVLPIGFGDYVLLQPELINTYAQAVITSLRDDPLERGCIAEERVLRGELTYPPGFDRLDEGDEWIVLQGMHKQLVERAICLREADPSGKGPTVLVFPSYYRRERPTRPGQPQAFMTFHFDGYLDEIYATLVVRLHHTQPFESSELWRNAADLETAAGQAIGLRLDRRPDGSGEHRARAGREANHRRRRASGDPTAV
jgi:GTPase SAR1 family protein